MEAATSVYWRAVAAGAAPFPASIREKRVTSRKEPADLLASALWVKLQEIVAQFEEALRRGERPNMAGLLPDGEGKLAVLLELAHTELEHRPNTGEPARVEDYLQRFPEMTGAAQAVGQRIGAEYELRRRREPGLAPEQYARRCPAYGPELGPLLAWQAGCPSFRPPTVGDPGKQADSVGPTPAAPAAASEVRLAGCEILSELGRSMPRQFRQTGDPGEIT